MIKPFRSIKQKLADGQGLRKYVAYAVGEIFLIVIGIVIALQLDNWNDRRIEMQIAKEILTGIRDDILQDTIDLNGNIRTYHRWTRRNVILLDHLIKKKDYEPWVGAGLMSCGFDDLTLTLHSSHFDQAKQRGLEIINDKHLRQQISRLYEFKYANLLYFENEFLANNHYNVIRPLVQPYLEFNEQLYKQDSLEAFKYPSMITSISYKRLLVDKNLQFVLFAYTQKNWQVLNNDYIRTRDEALRTVGLINEELEAHF